MSKQSRFDTPGSTLMMINGGLSGGMYDWHMDRRIRIIGRRSVFMMQVIMYSRSKQRWEIELDFIIVTIIVVFSTAMILVVVQDYAVHTAWHEIERLIFIVIFSTAIIIRYPFTMVMMPTTNDCRQSCC